MIRVVNKRHYNGPGEYIGRPSPLGNPFSHLKSPHAMRVGSRRESIDRFEEWLDEQPDDSPAKIELERLTEKYRSTGELVLICWCAPLDCHGHILARKIQEKADE